MTGYDRGVWATLDPLGLQADADLISAWFCFDGVPPGQYTVTVAPAPSLRPCNRFGCWPAKTPVTVVDRDVFVYIPIFDFTPTPSPTSLTRSTLDAIPGHTLHVATAPGAVLLGIEILAPN
ncbi:MAG: hypothetical protein HY699_07375 [Deltaproteobacteria bacterium]|nr:hypothetical protein [Deltaproteobacteria bacterium]